MDSEFRDRIMEAHKVRFQIALDIQNGLEAVGINILTYYNDLPARIELCGVELSMPGDGYGLGGVVDALIEMHKYGAFRAGKGRNNEDVVYYTSEKLSRQYVFYDGQIGSLSYWWEIKDLTKVK